MAEGDALGVGRYGSLGLAFMAAVVSAAISWGVQLDRSDQASEQIVSLSNRITTLALQIHTNAIAIATLTSGATSEARRTADNGERIESLVETHHRTEATMADLAARIRALEELQRRQVER